MILYVGSYTEEVLDDLKGHGDGIYCFEFDEVTGSLKLKHIEKHRNTSFLAISNTIDRLYSFQEVIESKSPTVLAYKINRDDSLTLLCEQPIKGGLPCHLELFNNDQQLAISCYYTGNLITYPLCKEGKFSVVNNNYKHCGCSINKERQQSPHAHMSYVDCKRNHLLIPDLGTDTIEVYNTDEHGLTKVQSIKAPLGSGPRHLDMHYSKNYAFVMHELDGTVGFLKHESNAWKYIKTYNSIPSDYDGTPSGSTIKVSKDGRFVYAGNRGSETIAIFSFDDKKETLTLIDQQITYGKTPRDFEFSPSGEWLLVGNQDSDTIIVFRVHKKTGKLTKVSENTEAKSPVCFKWKV